MSTTENRNDVFLAVGQLVVEMIEEVGGEMVDIERFKSWEGRVALCQLAGKLTDTRVFVMNEETAREAGILNPRGAFKEYFFGIVTFDTKKPVEMYCESLAKDASIGEIKSDIATLDASIETPLHFFMDSLREQRYGKKGPLLVNGKTNIFFVRGNNKVLWVLECWWSHRNRGWFLEAVPYEDEYKYKEGARVIYRAPVNAPA